MKKAILIGIMVCLIGITMDQMFHLYGIKITVTGDHVKARDRAYLARLLMFQTKMQNVNNLDIISNSLRLSDGTIVHVMSQHGLDSATIYVPVHVSMPPVEEKKEMFQSIFPYFTVNDLEFPTDGLLVFRGGYKLTGPYELFSPYYTYKDSFEWENPSYNYYTPYAYTNNSDQRVILEWQVKEYTDPFTNVYWDEIPWMDGPRDWDPVYYEEYSSDIVLDKPYSISREILSNTFPDASEGVPFPSSGTSTEALVLNGSSLVTWNTVQTIGSTGDHTVTHLTSNGEVTAWDPEHAIDQQDPTSFVMLYRKRDDDTLKANAGFDYCYTYTNQKIVFMGLGHHVEIPEAIIPDYRLSYHWDIYGWPEPSGYSTTVNAKIKLFKVGDKYVSLFKIALHPEYPGDDSDYQILIGCAVENGPFTVVDVTDGVEFMDENRLLASGFGLLLRRGDPAIMHTFNYIKEE